jgi:Sec-independent protein translocase protein TatA
VPASYGSSELILLGAIALLLFGPLAIPQLRPIRILARTSARTEDLSPAAPR